VGSLTLQTWEDVGGGATAIGVLVAVIAAAITYGQYIGGRQIQKEATAKQVYSNYLQLAIEHPSFASGFFPADPAEKERYKWFVSYMLNACEQILDATSDDKEWRDCGRAQIEFHKNYMVTDERFRTKEKYFYSREIRDFMDEVCGKSTSSAMRSADALTLQS
jgi:hypothetical protein